MDYRPDCSLRTILNDVFRTRYDAARILGYSDRMLRFYCAGTYPTPRRLHVILQTYLRQKLGARSARLKRALERAERETRREDAAFSQALQAFTALEAENARRGKK